MSVRFRRVWGLDVSLLSKFSPGTALTLTWVVKADKVTGACCCFSKYKCYTDVFIQIEFDPPFSGPAFDG